LDDPIIEADIGTAKISFTGWDEPNPGLGIQPILIIAEERLIRIRKHKDGASARGRETERHCAKNGHLKQVTKDIGNAFHNRFKSHWGSIVAPFVIVTAGGSCRHCSFSVYKCPSNAE
jgi:hypothetical protein